MAMGEQVSVTVKGKPYLLDKAEAAKAAAISAGKIQTVLKSYRKSMAYIEAVWTSHNDLRTDAFYTARIVETVARASFPPRSLIDGAEKALAKFEQAVAAKNAAAIKPAEQAAYQTMLQAARAVEKYGAGIDKGAGHIVSGLTMVKEGAEDSLEVMMDVLTLGKPGAASLGAAAVGSYKELLTQIMAAETSKNFDLVYAGIVVLSAGAREGFLKELMKDGGFSKKCLEHATEMIGKKLAQHVGSKVAAEVAKKMIGGGMEEAITEALRELIGSYTGGKKMTLDQAVEEVMKKAVQKARIVGVLAGLDKQLEQLSGVVLKKIVAGAIKEVKVTPGPAVEKKMREVVDKAAEKVVERFLIENGDDPKKLEKLTDEVTAKLLKDSAFKAAMAKAAGKK